MVSKEYIRKFPQKVNQVLQESGDDKEWLFHSILAILEKSSENLNFSEKRVIQNIHEYCVEKIVKKQAENFYKDFNIKDIKDDLVKDFFKMEHERRRDDFRNFCLTIFQQIENITNELFHSKLISQISNDRYKRAYTYQKSEDTIEMMLLWNDRFPEQDYDKKIEKIGTWPFMAKFKAVIYYYYFGKRVYNQFELFPKIRIGNQLYLMRNRVHRGPSINTEQEAKLDEIYQNRSIYYLRFLGFLEDFVWNVNKNIV